MAPSAQTIGFLINATNPYVELDVQDVAAASDRLRRKLVVLRVATRNDLEQTFARTLDQMLAFLAARIPGPDGRPDWEKVEAFSASNPETLRQADYIAAHPSPASFASTTYWGVHAF